MSSFWDERYAADEYVYGTKPNEYFKSIIDKLPAAKLLVPGAGEGRDAVYAAGLGWDVFAFDASSKGKEKALRLANEQNVTIRYDVKNAVEFDAAADSFDVVALIFFHLPDVARKPFYDKVVKALKPGGIIILESFTPEQLQNSSGGPKELQMLSTSESLKAEFEGLEIEQNIETETILDEGRFHRGKADTVRFLARKAL